MKKESWILTDLIKIRNRVDNEIYEMNELVKEKQETLDEFDAHIRELQRRSWE